MKVPKDVAAKCLELAGCDAPAGAGDLYGVLAAVRAAGFPDGEPEYRFAVTIGRRWAFDWCWPTYRVAFEREGGEFRPVNCPACGHRKTVFVSRHHSRDGLEADATKYNQAAVMGWLVIRATPRMIRDGRAAGDLIAALTERASK